MRCAITGLCACASRTIKRENLGRVWRSFDAVPFGDSSLKRVTITGPFDVNGGYIRVITIR